MIQSSSLRSPLVRRAIEAINEGRLEDFLALFAENATLIDGATYRGREAIRAWAQRETFGVQMRIDVQRETNADGTFLAIEAMSHGGYSGPGSFHFTLRGDMIERLVIH
ncbi:hypothetical protein KSF_049270 [Reticulibacter mediterranei]|uniref:SnoaL-like domain-containing protein n=1 Tax=Reticulibacter mediterranei TaxID=2778369 RepID=A0A8J3INM1_9CHLR|nr:nuclear transport factor 2 family protein [Reticulibacter mediterranei]GHO94879.1 hypothetical protein KSF_049270 [Reticulibacter mediterranei]